MIRVLCRVSMALAAFAQEVAEHYATHHPRVLVVLGWLRLAGLGWLAPVVSGWLALVRALRLANKLDAAVFRGKEKV